MKKHAYFKGDLCIKEPLLFEKIGKEYVMKKDKSFSYPAKVVENDPDWIVLKTVKGECKCKIDH